MEEVIYYNNLYDLYGVLRTDTQKKYFEDYYFNNLSLGEMAENYGVSRNAIFKQLHISTKKLEEYEEKLQFFNKLNRLYKYAEEKGNKDMKEQLDILF